MKKAPAPALLWLGILAADKTLCKPYEIDELIKAVKESLRWAR